MKLTAKSVVLGVSMSLMLTIAFIPQVFAIEGESDATRNSEESSDTTKLKEAEAEAEKSDAANESRTTSVRNKTDNPTGEARQEVAREKLDAKKKVACESRQSAVNKVMVTVVDRSKNHFDRITTIYDMSVKFYSDQELSLSNYDELVATVEAAKAAALTANQQLSETPEFSCQSDGPKADVQEFRNKRLDKVEAFGAYRDAVKALVKAMKAVATPAEAEQS